MKIQQFLITLALMLAAPVQTLPQARTFPLPQVPSALNTPQSRANYLAQHYWDRYDFKDNTLIGNKDVSEQGFSNFISIMPYVTEREAAFDSLAAHLMTNTRMLSYFIGLGEKYLYEPLSPIYDEALYILMLERLLLRQDLPAKERSNCRFDLKMAQKNRLGTVATDFSYVRKGDGKRGRLSDIRTEYTILLLGDPECDVCVAAKEELSASEAVGVLLRQKRLSVLSLCVMGKTAAWRRSSVPAEWIDACDKNMDVMDKSLYEIRGLPVLYLLDGERKVLMKNVEPGQIIKFLQPKAK